ncbi:hypothetical protein, partial [Vibrio metschnikovii]|uniref:hypothetical protein n=1 Tax=Vibrio metschnikovii TaxID=28172 RepID=UPI002FCA91FA
KKPQTAAKISSKDKQTLIIDRLAFVKQQGNRQGDERSLFSFRDLLHNRRLLSVSDVLSLWVMFSAVSDE